jgi:uncharacterized protein
MTSQNIPPLISARKAAIAGITYSGVVRGKDIGRVAAAVLEIEGPLSVSLRFDINEGRKRTVEAKIEGRVSMQCQRCLKPVSVLVETCSTLTVVAHDEEAASVLRTTEPLLLDGDDLDVYSLIEDEVLLALPIVALHSIDPVQAKEVVTKMVMASVEEQENAASAHGLEVQPNELVKEPAKSPFAALKEVKFNRS